MNRIPLGLVKIAGIVLLLVSLWALMAWYTPESFLQGNNLENLMRRTSLYGVLGVGVAFVIISGGIDLSIGSVVCFSGCLLAVLLQVSWPYAGESNVIEVDKRGTIVVSAPFEVEPNDAVWYYGGGRARNLFARVTTIEANGKTVTVTLDRPFTNDDISGNLVPLSSVVSVAGSQVSLPPETPVRSGDKVAFFHATKGQHNLSVKELAVDDGVVTVTLDREAPIDAEWHAAVQRRTAPMSVPAALVTVILAGLALGLLHGLLITRLNLQPFVVTLATLMIFRSLSRRIANDQMIGFGSDYPGLKHLGSGTWQVFGDKAMGIPWAFVVLVGVAIVAMIVLNMTVWGRHIQAVGRNEEATRFSGVNTKRTRLLAYVACSGLTALGGILFALDSGSIQPYNFGNFFELYAIAAAVLGGCTLRGGEGGIFGVIVGTALLQTLSNIILLWGIPQSLEHAVIGFVILIAVIVDELLRRFSRRRS